MTNNTNNTTATKCSVNLWGSNPGTNDDCWCGEDYATPEEAWAAFNNPAEAFPAYANDATVVFVEIRLPGFGTGTKRLRPDHAASKAPNTEAAMLAGMASGCAGYNDAMGF